MTSPAICVRARAGEVELGRSRFGGQPDLPARVSWPCAWGVPMELVAQVRLSDVAPHDVDGVLPADGFMLFFYNSQWATSFDEDEPYECGKVLFFGDAEPIVRTPAPSVELEDEYGRRIVPRSYPCAGLSFSPASAAGPRHQMLGSLAQHDDLGVMSEDDVLLFQIDSDPEAGFDWGKRWFLYFVAARSDVAKRDFSRVRAYHDICC